MRFLILLVIVVLLVLTFKALLSGPGAGANQRHKKRKTGSTGEKMVPCSVCDLHLPHSEAINLEGRYFCSHEHLQQWKDSNRADN